ncbi:MAG: TlyA family RNA methyltransferase [Planctomycetota bacterium]|nr:MAG: TlyA family RNA methyltransferase [Planctomycetota bacterium]
MINSGVCYSGTIARFDLRNSWAIEKHLLQRKEEMTSTDSSNRPYVSRSGTKLAAALDAFKVKPAGWVCADLGCNVGGFVDCLLQHGAEKVYAIDTGYGTLAYTLRKDPRVVVMERTNAMHVALPELMDLVTIDVAWTPQHHILPNALRLLKPDGRIITLIKPHYEADQSQLREGVLEPESAREVLDQICKHITKMGAKIGGIIESPITGNKGNVEFLALLTIDR